MVTTTERPSSPERRPTRRALLAGAAAAPVLALPAVALASPEPDPHLRWAREWQALADRLNTPGLVADEDASEVLDEQLRFEGLIAETPARTLAGVREQVAIVVRVMRHSTPAEVDRVALENAIATLERLAGEAGHG